MSVCDLGYVFSSGLGIMESSLFFFFLLLCLASCSHHLAPGFENQAKSLPPEWHENIPTYSQPSCRSLSSQPQTTSKDNRVGGLNGIQRNLMGQWRPKMRLLGVKIYMKINWFCGGFESKIKGATTRLPNVFFYPGQNFTISKEMQRERESSLKQVRQEKETGGVKERMGSELQWLVCVVNFLLPSAWRNSIDSLLSEARVICITYSPLLLPVASASPSVSVYSVRPRPCWIAPLLCRVDSLVRGWALIAMVLCWVRLCAIQTL